jgi:hypothetical protein
MPRFGASAVAAINISVAREGSALSPERRKRLKRVSPSSAAQHSGLLLHVVVRPEITEVTELVIRCQESNILQFTHAVLHVKHALSSFFEVADFILHLGIPCGRQARVILFL